MTSPTSSTPPHTFGPPNHQWTYVSHSQVGIYNLSTTARTRGFYMIRTHPAPGLKATFIGIDPPKSAFVIVDMQNYFLDPTCRKHPAGLAAVGSIVGVIARCRGLGIAVIWLNWGLTDTDLSTMPAGVLRSFMKNNSGGLGTDLGSNKGRTLFAGTWNADIYPPLKALVQADDIHCAKNRMSGLWDESQPLYKTLKERGIETVILGGVNTDQCVGGTLVDAYNKGWNCVMIDDCCGTTTEGGREVWVHNVLSNYGFVVDSSAFCNGFLGKKEEVGEGTENTAV